MEQIKRGGNYQHVSPPDRERWGRKVLPWPEAAKKLLIKQTGGVILSRIL